MIVTSQSMPGLCSSDCSPTQHMAKLLFPVAQRAGTPKPTHHVIAPLLCIHLQQCIAQVVGALDG
jgi:hypothetical protein